VSPLSTVSSCSFLPRPFNRDRRVREVAEAFAAGNRERNEERHEDIMALYEHVFLARQDLSQQQVDALVEQYKGVISANGGSVGRVENWGLKSLTYRVNKNRKAYLRLVVQMIDCGVTFISFQRVLGSIWLLILERATFSFSATITLLPGVGRHCYGSVTAQKMP
jgi:ribosomal protein S6